jgi:P4 family phage/plasmid primase-like protien
MTLHIPALPEDSDTLTAALLYAEAGWYIGPCDQASKHPGSILGKGWQHQTSRDPHQIAAWFAGSDAGLFLHVGRSGGLVLDVDDFSRLPDLALEVIEECQPPFQSTRANGHGRGHYVFSQPDDRLIGNSVGELGKGWGEVRGRNGIIVVEPTTHNKAAEGGQYHWERTGEVPFSALLCSALPDAADSADPATDAAVEAFLEAHTGASRPTLLQAVLAKFDNDVVAGGARHDALRDCSIWACREARAGLYPARTAMEKLWRKFNTVMKAKPVEGRFPASEFRGVFAWAVAQAMLTDPETRAAEVDERLEEVTFMARRPAPVIADPAVEEPAKPRDPRAYFHDKEAGVDVAMLADDVLARGPLRVGRDGMFWSYSGGVWREARDEVRGRVVDCLAGRYRGSHATNVEHVVARRVGSISGDPLPALINLRGDDQGKRGGMLDWRTGELLPWDAEYASTVQLPIHWDPEATCPRFDAFLAQVLSPEAVELAWEMLGYLMMSGNPLQTAFLFFGTGQNGKGTLMRVIQALLGTENTSSVSLDQLNANRFAPAALYGKTANIAGDIDATYQESTAAFKMLTGEDVFRGENKHRDGFQFVSWAVPLFSANEVPGSADTSEGYLRRWTVLHFGRHIESTERQAGLSDLLIQELPGIAVKAVAALRTLMDRGAFDTSKGDVAAAAEEFARKIDQIRQWIESACLTASRDGLTEAERSTLAGNREHAKDCYASYKLYHSAMNPGSRPMSAEKFYTRLAAIPGVEPKKVNGVRYFQGLRIVEQRMKGDGAAPEPAVRGMLAVDD